MDVRRWWDWMIVVGMWLMASPLNLADDPVVGANLVVSGLAVSTLYLTGLGSGRIWESRTAAVIGLWLIASPWILAFPASDFAVWNSVISGGLICLVAGWDSLEQGRSHHA